MMNPAPTDVDGARRMTTARACAAASFAIGATVLAGWAADVEALKSVFPGLVTLKPNSALGFVLGGLALGSVGGSRRADRLAAGLAAAVVALGLLTLWEYAAGVDLGIDQALFRETGRGQFSLSPGRMHPSTAADFTLLGVATILVAARRGERAAYALALVAATVAASALIGYAYGVRRFAGLAMFNQMALHTTVGMLALSAAVATCRPGRGLLAIVGGDGPGAQMARRLLPLAILLPFTLDGLALLSNRAQLFDERFATSMRVVATIAIFAGGIGWNALALRRADRDRRATEDRYRFMADAMPLLVWTAAPDGQADYFNRRWPAYTGSEAGADIGRWWSEVIHPEDRGRCLDRWAQAVRSGEGFEIEYRLRRADGAYRWHLGRAEPMRDGSGRATRWFGTCTDIHDQKVAGERRYRSLVEATTAIVWSTPASGEFESDQPGWSAFTGQPFEALKGWGWLDAVHPDDRAETARVWSGAVASRSPYEVGHRLRRHDGEYRHMMVRGVPILDEGGEIVEWVGVHADVDEQARAHQAMCRAKEAAEAATRAKGEFLANMSHEIRTPMNGILGMTELALGTDLTPVQREYLGLVKSSADALLTVIDDILDFSKIEAGKLALDPVPFDIREAVTDTLRALAFRAHDKGLELACRIAPGVPPTLVGDSGRLRQVLVNLVGNAIKFTAAGEVCVEVEAGPAAGGLREVRFAVADTGIGIPPGKREAIFAPFEQADGSTTRKYGGTGLGLSISCRLVELMGGRIGVDDNPGGGSLFRFDVHLAEGDPAATPPGRGPADPSRLAGVRALVVDDNRTNRRILEEILALWGCRAASVADALEALRALEEAAALGEPFEVVLLDRMMPGMDGCTLAERIRDNPGLRCPRMLMLTSGGGDESARYRELGIGAWMAKPIRQSELLVALLGRPDPAGKPERARCPDPAVPRIAGCRPLRVLLAEDHPVNQKVATRMLEEMGHRVEVVGDGRGAVSATAREPFDLVLMDVQMPEMDGFEALAAIRGRERATGGHLPIVALTAHAMAGDRERCIGSGFDDYLAKPIQSAGLRAVLARFAGEGAAPPAPAGPPPEPAPPAFDRAAALDNLGGDERLLAEVLGLFLDDAPRLLGEVRHAIEARDAPTLKRLGHTLAGVSSNFNATALVASARRLEAMGHAGNLAGAEDAEAELGQTFDGFRAAVAASGECVEAA